MDLIEKEAEVLIQNRIVLPKEKGVLGLSGGGDSVALFYILLELRAKIDFEFTAVHVHHGIREGSADEDLEYVKKLCNEHGIMLRAVYADVPSLSKEQGISTELAGRKVRKKAFDEELKKTKAEKLFLAHHANDQEETILMNFLRGSGLAGLSGMKQVQEYEYDGGHALVLRPLLGETHEDILSCLRNRNIIWREDESNAEQIYTRNIMRLKILPQIKDLYPGLTAVMGRTGQIMAENSEFMILKAKEFIEEHAVVDGEELKIRVEDMKSIHIALRREIVRQAVLRTGGLVDVTYAQDELILSLLESQSGKSVSIEGGREIRRSFEYIIFGENHQEKELSLTVTCCDKKPEEIINIIKNNTAQTYTKWMDCDKIARYAAGEIVVREPQEGDYLIIDRQGHKKKLSVYLKQQKLDIKKRLNISVAAVGSLILAVDGYRDSCGFEVDENSKNIIMIKRTLREEG